MGYPMHYDNTEEIWDESAFPLPQIYGRDLNGKMDANHASNGPVTQKIPTTRARSTFMTELSLPQPTAKAVSITSRGYR